MTWASAPSMRFDEYGNKMVPKMSKRTRDRRHTDRTLPWRSEHGHVYLVPLDPGNLSALDLRVVKWQVATPSHVRPSRVPGKVDTPKPRCLGSAHACPNKIKFELHLNPNLRHIDLNPFEERLGEPQPVYFGEGLTEDGQVPEIEESLHRLKDRQLASVELTEEINVFAWSYVDMSGLDPSIVKHFFPLDTEKFPPKRQQLRRKWASLLLRIKEEVIKQINAGFLEVCNYFEWVANIVPVKKKDGRVRVYVDYRDLNKASPKDNFPLPHIDVLVDSTVRHAQFPFMDGISGDSDSTCSITQLACSMRNIAKWRCQLTEYDIEYVSRTLVKGQAIANHLAEFPINDDTPINADFPDEGILQVNDEKDEPTWKMYFDGAEYEACILGLRAAIEFKGNLIEPLEIRIAKGPAHCNAIEATDAKLWYEDIKHLLQTGQYPPFADRRDRKTLRRLAVHYFLSGGTLNRRSFDTTLLRCIDIHESQRLMEETDCVKHVRHCHRCQVYADHIKAPPNELRPMTTPWPFLMWGMDVISPINPKASNGHLFILVAIDYFTKWIEAITLASVTAKAVARFLKRDVIA
ncbi:hypothetical protein CRG98_034425 [Punica granatum]|uniref:Integrase catalytic domain-containing protein n=1 Tax=Punica granatum TaxID=22663 RepID=A0A2I0IME9_PUNGR|nr:hypothetical protein CRG98_034425 [Punica granatum]